MKLKFNKIGSFAFILAAFTSFCIAMWSIYLNRAASAAVAASFCVVFVILRHLPVLDSFEAFSMKAKFNRQVEEAEEVLSLLRGTGETLAKLAFLQLAVVDRMTSLPWLRKHVLANDLALKLSELKISEENIKLAQAPLLNVLQIDLYFAFENVAQKLRTEANHEIGQALATLKHAELRGEDVASKQQKLEERRALLGSAQSLQFPQLTDQPVEVDFDHFTKLKIQGLELPTDEAVLLENFRQKILSLQKECVAKSAITPDALQFLSKDINRDELFVSVMKR